MRSTSFVGIFGKSEEERLEARLIGSFQSSPSADAERTKKKLILYSREKPMETVTILLKHYQDENPSIRSSVRDTLKELAADGPALRCVLDDMVHPSRSVRKAVQAFLGDLLGPHATVYASLYEQTMLVVATSRRKDVPVEDIISLAERSKRTVLEGDVMLAVRDIGFSLDIARHRNRSSEQLRQYLSEMLRMSPDLSRMGVDPGPIEEPLRKALKAGRERSYDETRDIIVVRNAEDELRDDLRSLVASYAQDTGGRSMRDPHHLADKDMAPLRPLRVLIGSLDRPVEDDQRLDAVTTLARAVGQFRETYERELRPRVLSGDDGAIQAMYQATLISVKLSSHLLPSMAEALYQEHLRGIEGAPSIQVVRLHRC